MKQRAMAIAIATLMVAAGLSLAPQAAASHNDCHRDFVLAEDKSNAQLRPLAVNEEEIGRADVSAGTPEDLMVDLDTQNAELSVEVFHKTDLGCVEYKPSSCDKTVSSTGDTKICTLDDPDNGEKNYFAHFVNTGDIDLDYQAWTPDA